MSRMIKGLSNRPSSLANNRRFLQSTRKKRSMQLRIIASKQNRTLLSILKYNYNSKAERMNRSSHLSSRNNEFTNHNKARNQLNNLIGASWTSNIRQKITMNNHSNHKLQSKPNPKSPRSLNCYLTPHKSTLISSNTCSTNPTNQKVTNRTNMISNPSRLSFTSNSSSKDSKDSGKQSRINI